MKPEEAIKILANGDRSVDRVLEAMEMGISALKKSVPVRPIRRDGVIRCPSCRWCFGSMETPGALCCPGCGQRIDWA